jgi:hypothetical protein
MATHMESGAPLTAETIREALLVRARASRDFDAAYYEQDATRSLHDAEGHLTGNAAEACTRLNEADVALARLAKSVLAVVEGLCPHCLGTESEPAYPCNFTPVATEGEVLF